MESLRDVVVFFAAGLDHTRIEIERNSIKNTMQESSPSDLAIRLGAIVHPPNFDDFQAIA